MTDYGTETSEIFMLSDDDEDRNRPCDTNLTIYVWSASGPVQSAAAWKQSRG